MIPRKFPGLRNRVVVKQIGYKFPKKGNNEGVYGFEN
jgi:hypothetical protein